LDAQPMFIHECEWTIPLGLTLAHLRNLCENDVVLWGLETVFEVGVFQFVAFPELV